MVAQALADDAFEAGYRSFHEVVHTSILGDVDLVELPWKPGFEARLIFPLKYPRFWEIWNQVTLVAGFQEDLRPCSLRVGAGGRLDGQRRSYLIISFAVY